MLNFTSARARGCCATRTTPNWPTPRDQPVLPDDGSERALWPSCCFRSPPASSPPRRWITARSPWSPRPPAPTGCRICGSVTLPVPAATVYIPVVNVVLCVATLSRDACCSAIRTYPRRATRLGTDHHDDHHHDPAGHLPVATAATSSAPLVFTIVFLAIQGPVLRRPMAKFPHGGWFTHKRSRWRSPLIMYTWERGAPGWSASSVGT